MPFCRLQVSAEPRRSDTSSSTVPSERPLNCFLFDRLLAEGQKPGRQIRHGKSPPRGRLEILGRRESSRPSQPVLPKCTSWHGYQEKRKKKALEIYFVLDHKFHEEPPQTHSLDALICLLPDTIALIRVGFVAGSVIEKRTKLPSILKRRAVAPLRVDGNALAILAGVSSHRLKAGLVC